MPPGATAKGELGRVEVMKTLLICHEDSALTRKGLTRWLASFSDLVGIVAINEAQGRVRKRIRREIKRVGILRFLDVVAFRLYYRLFLAGKDESWEHQELDHLFHLYREIPANTQILTTHSPNSGEAEKFITARKPDIVIARCKTLLKRSIFTIPSKGTFVMHPGICPEYRNSHGCFWALANDDLTKVGMTLLRIDDGVDTGPVYGYFTYPFDEVNESHVIIQHRVLMENLSAMARTLKGIYAGDARPLDTSGRQSQTWGQPWLTRYLRWKRAAKKRAL